MDNKFDSKAKIMEYKSNIIKNIKANWLIEFPDKYPKKGEDRDQFFNNRIDYCKQKRTEILNIPNITSTDLGELLAYDEILKSLYSDLNSKFIIVFD